jgi:stage V sporulation protein R
MVDRELQILEKEIDVIAHQAKVFGLDFFEVHFEICPAEVIYNFGAYGMPARFSHWSFGKAFHRLKTQYDYNLSRIYELVINTDPCYAFLLEGNSLLQQKLVIAHVFAHCDFFKNNAYFKRTSRQMLELMSRHAQRIQEYEYKFGRREVEIFLDAVLALQEHIDSYPLARPVVAEEKETPYDDLWLLEKKPVVVEKKQKKLPEHPEKDLLDFIVRHSRHLEDWQRDIVAMLREEMLYFWPQMETKIINEGWAAFWHTRIIRELDLTSAEAIEFAKMHAQLLQTTKMQINPYYVGLKIFEDIERRFENGMEKIFEVRETESDSSLLRNYLTRKLVEDLDLYLYQKVGSDWVIVEKNWEKVRDGLVTLMANCGFPSLMVHDGDYQGRGELLLKHQYEGRELDVPYLEKTIPYVYLLWGRPVHLETMIREKPVIFSYDGKKCMNRVGNA